MRDDLKKALDREQRRQRLKVIVPAVLAGGALVAAFVVFTLPPVQLGETTVTIRELQPLPSDDEQQLRLIVESPDGRAFRMRALPGDGALAVGATLCVMETRRRVFGTPKLIRLPDTRCP